MNIMLKMSQLNSLIGDIFNGIGNFFTNIVSAILGWLFIMLYYVFVTPFFLAMDGVQVLFRKFAGLDVYVIEGETKSGDIILSLINNETVQNVFWSLVILAVVLLIITTIVALIRAQTQTADDKDRKTNNQIFVTAVKALVNFFMVPVVAILGIFMGNALLKSLDQATSGGKDMRMSSMVFVACAYDSNRARNNEQFKKDVANGKNAFGVLNGDEEKVADRIDEAFKNYTKFDTSTFQEVDAGSLFGDKDGNTYGFMHAIEVYSSGQFYNMQRSGFSIYDIYQVWYYYDLTAFNYLFALIASIFVCWVLLSAAVGLVKRMFKVTILLCISPIVASTMPLDNGKALKSWREGFIGSVLSAYATVVVLNLTFVLLGPINQIDFFYGDVLQAGINQVTQLIIICSAMYFFKDLTSELAKMFGMENAYADGDKATQDLGAKMAKGVGIATAGVSGLRAAKMARKAHNVGDEKAAEQYRDKAKAKLSMARDRFAGLATNGVADKVMGEHDALDKRYSYRSKDKAVSTLKKDGTQQAIKEKYNKNASPLQRFKDTTLGAIGTGILKKGKSAVDGLKVAKNNIKDSLTGMAKNSFVGKKVQKKVQESNDVKELANQMTIKDLTSLNRGYKKQLKNQNLSEEKRKQIEHDQKLTQKAIEKRREENASKKAARQNTKPISILKSQAIYLKAAISSVRSKNEKFKTKPSQDNNEKK